MPFAKNQRQLNVVLPCAAYQTLGALAHQEGVTIAAHARAVLLRDLAQHGVVIPPEQMPRPHSVASAPPVPLPPPAAGQEPLELSASSPEVQAALGGSMRAARGKRRRGQTPSPTSPPPPAAAPTAPTAAEIAAMLASHYAGDEELVP